MNEAWRRFRKDRIAVIGAVVVVVISLAALFAPLIVPYDPNEQFFDGLTLEGAPLPPGGEFWLGTDLLGRDLFSRLLYGARDSVHSMRPGASEPIMAIRGTGGWPGGQSNSPS